MKLSLLMAFTLIASSAFASNTPHNYCDKLPGKWHAAIHIKDKSLCDSYGGCEHFDLITFKKTGKDEYLTTMYFSKDASKITVQSFPFSCQGEQIRFEGEEGKTIDLVCDEMNNCYMVMDTPNFTSELVKQ